MGAGLLQERRPAHHRARRRTSASRSTSSRPARRSSRRIKELRGTVILPGAHRPDRRRALLGAPATRRTSSGTARASSATRSRPARTASSPTRPRARSAADRPASSRCFVAAWAPAAAPAPATSNARSTRAATQAMEFAGGNFGMVESAYDYAQGHHGAEDARSRSRPTRARLPGQLQVQLGRRGGGHPLHDRRLHADARRRRQYNNQRARSIGEVLTITKLGAYRDQVVRRGHQGQPVRGPDQARARGSRARSRGTVGGSVPATLALTLGAPATFGAFTPGVARTYTASTRMTLHPHGLRGRILRVADPSAIYRGKLVSGVFALPESLSQGRGVAENAARALTSNEATCSWHVRPRSIECETHASSMGEDRESPTPSLRARRPSEAQQAPSVSPEGAHLHGWTSVFAFTSCNDCSDEAVTRATTWSSNERLLHGWERVGISLFTAAIALGCCAPAALADDAQRLHDGRALLRR